MRLTKDPVKIVSFIFYVTGILIIWKQYGLTLLVGAFLIGLSYTLIYYNK